MVKILSTQKNKNQISFVSDQSGQGQYRTILPYTYLNSMKLTNMIFMPTFINDENILKNCSAIRFQRQCTDEHLSAFKWYYMKLRQLKQYNTKLIYEVDDIVHELPDYNPANSKFKTKDLENILYMMRNSHIVQFTTKYIKTYYEKNYGITNSIVVPNMLPVHLWKNNISVNKEKIKKPRIFYSGSLSHYGKHSEFEFILQLIEKTYKKYNWVLMSNPEYFHRPVSKDILESIDFIKPTSFYLYPNSMKSAKADIAIAPLVNNIFNNGKSNLKLLEYSALGYPAVFSNITPYKNVPSRINNLDVDEWEAEIDKLSVNPNYRNQVLKGQLKILDKHWLDIPKNINKWIQPLI